MILISPWSRNTTEGKPSPKNYPHWAEVVSGLSKAGYDTVQVSCAGEADVPGVRRVDDLRLSDIAELMRSCETWISVDNFFHHMAWTLGIPGVVIFGMSSPIIFGHVGNTNLLKDRHFLRLRQFGLWSQEPPNPKAFVDPQVVVDAAVSLIKRKSGEKLLVEGE
jgi:ADP-heptose:LPS heptosyltransferase